MKEVAFDWSRQCDTKLSNQECCMLHGEYKMRLYRIPALCLALTCLLSACAFGASPADTPSTSTSTIAPTAAGSADSSAASADTDDSAGTSGQPVTITFALWE